MKIQIKNGTMKEKIKRKKKGGEMGEYIGKRLKDNYEEEFTVLSEFSKKHNLDVGSVCKAVKKQLVCIGGWVFKNKHEKNYPKVPKTTFIGKRIEDGYEEEFVIKKDFAKKHNLSTCRLRQVLNSSKKNYKVEEKTLWVFRKEDEEYKSIKKYKAINKVEKLEIEFENIRKFSEEHNLDKYYISKIINGKIGYKSFKGWIFEKID